MMRPFPLLGDKVSNTRLEADAKVKLGCGLCQHVWTSASAESVPSCPKCGGDKLVIKLYCGLCKNVWVIMSTESFYCPKCGSSNVISI